MTTVVTFEGDGETGSGEDVTYTAPDHDDLPADEMLAGTWTLDELSRQLDGLTLWGGEPKMHASIDYRRWAFESAALDLGAASGRPVARRRARPRVPPRALRRVDARRDRAVPRARIPTLEFKLDVERRLGPRADGAARRDRPRARAST